MVKDLIIFVFFQYNSVHDSINLLDFSIYLEMGVHCTCIAFLKITS